LPHLSVLLQEKGSGCDLIEAILSHINEHKQIFGIPFREKLSFVMMMPSRGKKYDKGRITYAILDNSQPTPLLYAKISRDPSFDSILEREHTQLTYLRSLNDPIINCSIPTPIQLAKIQDRTILFESALSGRTMLNFIDNLAAETEVDIPLYTERFINLIEKWLHHFQSVTRHGTETISESFLEQRVKPILDKYLTYLGFTNDCRKICSILLQGFKSFEGATLPIVVANGNLAPQTILVDDRLSKIGIVDWKFCETTPLVLREHYCFSQYIFYEWLHRGFLAEGDIENLWTQTFLNFDNSLGKLLISFIELTDERLGIEKGLMDILFPLFLANELNVQMEYSKFIPDHRMIYEVRFLELWVNEKFSH